MNIYFIYLSCPCLNESLGIFYNKHGQNGRVVAANVEYERLSIGFDYNINHLVSVPGLDRVMMRKKVKRLEMSLGLRHLRRCL